MGVCRVAAGLLSHCRRYHGRLRNASWPALLVQASRRATQVRRPLSNQSRLHTASTPELVLSIEHFPAPIHAKHPLNLSGSIGGGVPHAFLRQCFLQCDQRRHSPRVADLSLAETPFWHGSLVCAADGALS